MEDMGRIAHPSWHQQVHVPRQAEHEKRSETVRPRQARTSKASTMSMSPPIRTSRSHSPLPSGTRVESDGGLCSPKNYRPTMSSSSPNDRAYGEGSFPRADFSKQPNGRQPEIDRSGSLRPPRLATTHLTPPVVSKGGGISDSKEYRQLLPTSSFGTQGRASEPASMPSHNPPRPMVAPRSQHSEPTLKASDNNVYTIKKRTRGTSAFAQPQNAKEIDATGAVIVGTSSINDEDQEDDFMQAAVAPPNLDRRRTAQLEALRESMDAGGSTEYEESEELAVEQEFRAGAFAVAPGQEPRARTRSFDDYLLTSSQLSADPANSRAFTVTDMMSQEEETADRTSQVDRTQDSKNSSGTSDTLPMFDGEQNEKGTSWRVSRLWRGLACGLVLLSAGIAAAVVLTKSPEDSQDKSSQTIVMVPTASPSVMVLPTPPPITNAPTNIARTQSFVQVLVDKNVSSSLDLVTEGTPQYSAVRWLANFDPAQLDPENAALEPSICDRYIAAVLYYSLGLESAALYSSAFGPWLSQLPICDWNDGSGVSSQGISCSTGMTIRLEDHGLQGSIVSEVGSLQSLEALVLSGNDFQRTSLPTELGLLQNLRVLDFKRNNIGGSIPTELCVMGSLQEVALSDNQLEGSIPVELASCLELEVLDLSLNSLSGLMIPEGLFSLTNLAELRLDNNDLVGGIPTEIGMLTALSVFKLGQNYNLGSTLPTELGLLTRLQSFTLDYSALTGNLPSEMGKLVELTRIKLNGNLLEGTIPTEFAQLSQLTSFVIDTNFLTGSIPDLSNWSQVIEFQFSSNKLSGSLDEVCYASSPTLEFACADCNSQNVVCSCCAERFCCT